MGNWALIGKDPTELSTVKDKDLLLGGPGREKIGASLECGVPEEVLSIKISLNKYYFGRAWSLYLRSTYV